jgi:type IV fimbrial biogenesis protein FimT
MKTLVLPKKAQKGFTMIELMIVTAIFAMVMAVGAPSMSGMIQRNSLQSATSDLTMGLLYARSEAVKRNERIRFYRWTNGWGVYVDGKGYVDYQYYPENVYQTGPSTIYFNPNGRAEIWGTIRHFELTHTEGDQPKRCVYLDAGGTARAMIDKDEDGICANG